MSLNTRKKRKKEVREEVIEQTGEIFQLPEEALLHIFKSFTIEELILAAGICKLFRRIAYDDELWKTVDLTIKLHPNRLLVKFFNRFPNDSTECLRLCGAATTGTQNIAKPPPFSEKLSSMIRTAYPNLRHLYIARYDFRDDPAAVKNITYLPTNLESLVLTKCEMLMTSIQGNNDFLKLPKFPLKNATPNFTLQHLQHLSFDQSSCLALVSVRYLPDLCPKLVELNLNGCFRITRTRAFSDILISFSRTLRRLYLKATNVDDDTMHCICRKLKLLNVLNIQECKHLTRNIVDNLLTLRQLKTLLAENHIYIPYQEAKKNEE